MKLAATLVIAVLLSGCAHTPTSDFVQGSIRITPPIHEDTKVDFAIIEDGGTVPGRFTDAKGRVFDYYIDRRIHTKTRGAIYLNAYPTEPKSVCVENEAEFRRKLGFSQQ
jgi:hypothetical protein